MVREADGWDFQWGVINKKGKEVVKCKYDGGGYFSERLAMVEKDGKWGYINTKGKEVFMLI